MSVAGGAGCVLYTVYIFWPLMCPRQKISRDELCDKVGLTVFKNCAGMGTSKDSVTPTSTWCLDSAVWHYTTFSALEDTANSGNVNQQLK